MAVGLLAVSVAVMIPVEAGVAEDPVPPVTLGEVGVGSGGGAENDSFAAAAASPGMVLMVNETGFIDMSIDALPDSGTFIVEKGSADVSVRRAFLFAATDAMVDGSKDHVFLDGQTVPLGHEVHSNMGATNYWTEVTNIVKPIVDDETDDFALVDYTEGCFAGDDCELDGAILAVIYDTPGPFAERSIGFMYGALQTGGDTFQVALDQPFDTAADTLDMSLGISFSCQIDCQGPGTGWYPQYSTVDVNGERMTSEAGGANDGASGQGSLITVGGNGDSTANPSDPYALPGQQLFFPDDELYDLSALVEQGSTSVEIATTNPSDNDNIFFAAFRSSPPITGIQTGADLSGFTQGSPYAGDPVDAASGNFLDTTTDLTGPEGTTLSVERTYNSFDTRTGIFGRGWSTLFDASVTVAADGRAAVRLEDGRTAFFTPDGTGGWTRPDRLDADLTGSPGSFVLEWDDGREWSFDAEDFIVEATTPEGETISLIRSGVYVGTVTSVVGGSTRFQLDMTYAAAGSGIAVDAITTSDGRAVDVLADTGSTAGEPPIVTRVGAVRPTSADPWSAGWWQYSYDATDRLVRMEHTVDAGANPSATTVRTRLKVANTYDPSGRVLSQISPEGTTTTFAYGSGTTTVTDGASGDETTYLSDDDGRMVGVTDAELAGLTQDWGANGEVIETTDRAGATTRSLHDAQGRVRARLLPDPATGAAQTPGTGQDWTNIATWGTRYETFDYATSLGPADPRVTRHRNAAGEVTEMTYSGSLPYPATVTTAAGTSSAATTTTTYISSGPATGMVDVVTSPEGVVTDHAYDPATGDLASVTDGGRTTVHDTVRKTDTGWLAAWTTAEPTAVRATVVTTPGTGSAASRQTVTLFRSDDQPLRVIDPLAGTGVAGHQPARSTYDDIGRESTTVDEGGGTTTTSDRYSTDRLVPRDPATPCGCSADPAWTEPASVGRVETVTDPDGVVTTNRYSPNGDLVEERVSEGAATPTVTRHTYGSLGRRTRTEVDAGTTASPLVETTTFGYGPNGEQTMVTQGPFLGVTTRTMTTEYDKIGRVTAELGPMGDPERHHVTYTYDALDRVIAQVDAASDPDARLMTTWRYDASGRVVEQVAYLDGYADTANPYPSLSAHPDARVTRYSYDDDGNQVTTVEGPPNVSTYTWPASETRAQLDAIGPTDARRVTRNAYDPTTGDLVEVTRPDRTKVTTTYDAAGRPRDLIETAAPPTSGSPATRLIARYDYDLRGRILHETRNWVSPTGVVGEVVVDRSWTPTGRLASETDPHLPAAPAGDISTRRRTYTAAGRLQESRDALGTRTTYTYLKGLRTKRQVWNAAGTAVVSEEDHTYTRNGRPLTTTVPHAPSLASPAVDTTTYDDRGRVTLTVDASGRRTGHTYTNGGQPATTTWKLNFSDPTLTTSTATYDGAGRRVGTTGTHGAHTWTYDRLGQLTATTRPGPSGALQEQYRWDLAGNRTWSRSPNGRRLRYDWDKMARMSMVAVDLAAEPNPPSWLAIGSYGRSGFGDMTRESLSVFSLGGQRVWTRDLMGRTVTYAQSVQPSGQPATTTSTTLTHRPDGRIGTEATVGQPSWAYDYDDAGQLLSADPSTGTTLTWAYGRTGQRTSSTDATGTTTYTWDGGRRRLNSMTTPTGTRAFTYDGANRRATEAFTPTSGTPTTRTFTYDDRGQMSLMVDATNNLSRSYDVDGRLIAMAENSPGGATATLAWDTVPVVDQVSEMTIGATNIAYTTGESRLHQSHTGGSAYFAYDVHGSAVGTAVTSGPTSYDPWGLSTQPPGLDFGYRSELTVTGYVHLRAREYDPRTGTFLSADPLDPVDGSPAGNNPLHYADNDPLNKVDPLGLRPCDQTNCFGPAPTDPGLVVPCEDVVNDILVPARATSTSSRIQPFIQGQVWNCQVRLFRGDHAHLFGKGIFQSRAMPNEYYLGLVAGTNASVPTDQFTWADTSKGGRVVGNSALTLLTNSGFAMGVEAISTSYYEISYVHDGRTSAAPWVNPAMQRKIGGRTGAVSFRTPASADCIDWKVINLFGVLPWVWTSDRYACLGPESRPPWPGFTPWNDSGHV